MPFAKMFLKNFLFTGFAFVFMQAVYPQAGLQNTIQQSEKYVCSPCGQDCDKIEYNKPGTCPHCGMALVKKSTVTFKTIQPGEICNYLKKHPHVVLLDVRTREEFERKANPDYGTLQNAINIPVQELENRLNEISSLKKREVIVYCSHSHRSPQASYILSQNGFTDVTNMAGGMSVMNDNPCKK
jgi:rhodanese-related sulfurtransferase/DNA-directed RNA polymerase subunit RPC12/RpoP